MKFPIKETDYIQAVTLAMEESLQINWPVYLFRNNSGYYWIDILGEIFSDEKLIMSIFKGEVK